MNTSQCAVYQVKETPEYRNVRFRSYAKLKSEGKEVRAENYQQVYIGRIQPEETPADIKTRLQKQRPKNFKGHSIGFRINSAMLMLTALARSCKSSYSVSFMRIWMLLLRTVCSSFFGLVIFFSFLLYGSEYRKKHSQKSVMTKDENSSCCDHVHGNQYVCF